MLVVATRVSTHPVYKGKGSVDAIFSVLKIVEKLLENNMKLRTTSLNVTQQNALHKKEEKECCRKNIK